MTNPQDFSSTAELDTIVVVPVLNESTHLGKVVSALRADEQARRRSELWIVDGGSDDDTVVRALQLASADCGVRVMHNPDRLQASAVNMAALEADKRGARYLIRADAHAAYPPAWISRLIATAEAEGADSVVVPMATLGGGAVRDAAADLFNSWLGNGGSPHRTGARRGVVEHGHHALFRLEAFLTAGGYDTAFAANEDAELDMRLVRQGRRIFLENRATIGYYPRSSLWSILRQFYRNGRYRVRSSRKHGIPLQLRQLAPTVLVLMLLGALAAGVLIHPILLAPLAGYLASVIIAALVVATKKSLSRIALVSAAAVASHLAFGFGALVSLGSSLLASGGHSRSGLPLLRFNMLRSNDR